MQRRFLYPIYYGENQDHNVCDDSLALATFAVLSYLKRRSTQAPTKTIRVIWDYETTLETPSDNLEGMRSLH